MFARIATLGILLPAWLGCTGTLGDAPVEPDELEPVLEPKSVPAEPAVIMGSGFCVPLAEGERLGSVSPEGHAWLVGATPDGQRFRVLDPFDAEAETITDVALAEVLELRAWSDVEAAMITSDGLWRLENMARIQVTPPTDLSDATLCGDPGSNGFVLSPGALYERRNKEWYVWDAETTGAAAPSTLVDYDGECLSTANATWMTAGDGTLWRLESATVFRPQQFEPGAATAATADIFAVLESAQLITGPDRWQPWFFNGNTPTVIAASGGQVWMAAERQLLRFDGESFVTVTHPLEASITHIAAHANGAWLVGEDTVCHVTTAPMLRVTGLRAYSRSKELNYPFLVTTSEPGLTITASIADESIDLTLDEETGWMAGTARLDAIGWGDLSIEVDGRSRSIPVKRLPEITRSWSADVEPIYAANCTGTECHGGDADDVPDLGTFDSWVGVAEALRTRVVATETMPPPSSRTAEWTDEQVQIISEWLEGGMLP